MGEWVCGELDSWDGGDFSLVVEAGMLVMLPKSICGALCSGGTDWLQSEMIILEMVKWRWWTMAKRTWRRSGNKKKGKTCERCFRQLSSIYRSFQSYLCKNNHKKSSHSAEQYKEAPEFNLFGIGDGNYPLTLRFFYSTAFVPRCRSFWVQCTNPECLSERKTRPTSHSSVANTSRQRTYVVCLGAVAIYAYPFSLTLNPTIVQSRNDPESGQHHPSWLRPPSPFTTTTTTHHPPQPTPDDDLLLLGAVGTETPLHWAAVHNLDEFFSQVYRYWEEKGFTVIIVSRLLNLLALAFTIFASGVLLLGIDYSALHADCLKKETCNVWDVAVIRHPLAGRLTLWKLLSVVYLALFVGYWAFAVAHLVREVRGLAEVKLFFAQRVGMSERGVRAATWPEVAARLVAAQKNVRLCISRDLNEHDIVSRIMRRENYLIGMLSRGVLALHLPLPRLHPHVLLTKTVEWNLRWCVLDPMFDDSTFKINQAFVKDVSALQKRFRAMAIVNACLSPFVLVFLVTYFFMKNAEALYHHPSSIGARRWSPSARWSLREYNELGHFLDQRLNAGHAAAERYVAQFPNYAVSHVAKFIAFVAGSFAAVLIALTLLDERLLEQDLVVGRQTVWWLALLGVILAASRALIVEPSNTAFDPGLALLEVAAHTHFFPRHWRGRAHSLEVQEEFQSLFRYRAALFVEELASVLLTPVLLWFSLPQCAPAILDFVSNNTIAVDGVGDVCSLAAFQMRRHFVPNGDPLPAVAPLATATATAETATATEEVAAQEGKLEKSLVSFASAYPTWTPPLDAQDVLNRVCSSIGSSVPNVHGIEVSMDVKDPGESMMASMLGLYHTTSDQACIDPLFGLLTSRYPHFAKVYLQQQQQQLQAAKQRQQRHHHPHQQQRGGVGGDGIGLFASAEAIHHAPSGVQRGLEVAAAAAAAEVMAPEDERIVIGQALLQRYHDQQYEHQMQVRSASVSNTNTNQSLSLAGASFVPSLTSTSTVAPTPTPTTMPTPAPLPSGSLPRPVPSTSYLQQPSALSSSMKRWSSSRSPSTHTNTHSASSPAPSSAPAPAPAPRSLRELSSELSVFVGGNGNVNGSREPSETGMHSTTPSPLLPPPPASP